MVTLTWFIIGLEKGGERHTNVCHDYPYLVYYWSGKRWRERHIQIYVMVTLTWFIIGLGKGGKRHIQMYVMITLTWFIIGLEKDGERDTYKYMSWLPLLGLLLV
jgi:hypothetical protein